MFDTIKYVRRRLSGIVDSQGSPLYDERECRALADLLLEEVCGISRVDRIMHPDQVLPAEQRQRLMEVLEAMETGIPVQQALGYAWFCGARFRVTPDVLIPRPETAELADWILSDVRSRGTSASPAAGLSICDIGTGSGCIAISLARAIPDARVLALDLSTAALNIARENACQQHVDNVQFAQFDVLGDVDNLCFDTDSNNQNSTCQQAYQHFDILVSNPPYVCENEASEMSEIVLKHEPRLALFVPDDDPLLFYRAIGRFGLRHLKPNGLLYFEINAAYGRATCQLLNELGYHDVELRCDVTGRDRMVKASKIVNC